jgi:hypothetical protein|nr:MAG TPA: hypothetical protein [Caudoviricetes sp.]
MDVEFDDINKISSTIIWLDINTIVRINANMWNTSKRYGRSSYHKEIRYYNEKVEKQLVNINLDIDSYMTIENLKPNEKTHEKAFIKLRTADLYLFRNALISMYTLLEKDYSSIFKIKGGKPVVQNIKPVEVNCSNIVGTYMVLTPDVIESKDGKVKGGIRINLSSTTNFVLMDMTKLLELKEILNTINLPMYGQMLINYVGRPKLGYNLIQVGDAGEGEGVSSPVKGRTLADLMKKGNNNQFGLL